MQNTKSFQVGRKYYSNLHSKLYLNAYEFFLYEDARVPSTNLLPVGRRVSELPAEEQAVIMDAVQRSVEYRKSKSLDGPNIMTVHNADGTIVHRIIDDHIIEK